MTVLESMEKPGKKLLATGNGRCNLTNQSAGDARYYRSSEKGVQASIKQADTPKETLADFAGLGLFVQEKQERLSSTRLPARLLPVLDSASVWKRLRGR